MKDPKQKKEVVAEPPENETETDLLSGQELLPLEEDHLPTSLNEELEEKLRDDPNKFIGCGG